MKGEVGRSPFPSGDIYSINMTYRGVEICLQDHANISKTVSRVFLFYSLFFSFSFFVFTPTEFTVPELCDDNAVYRIGF